MSEKQIFINMLDRAGIGHGLRDDYGDNPGVAVQVESDCEDGGFMITEFWFDQHGKLSTVEVYKGEEY